MGRTNRHRKKTKARSFELTNHLSDIVSLHVWLARQDCIYNNKLAFADFKNIGRGIITKKKIYAGELLIDLPLNLTINVTTVLMDEVFAEIFSKNKLDFEECYNDRVSLQSLLAFYLLFLKSQSVCSVWHVYINSLPVKYTVPYFLNSDAKQCLERKMRTVVAKQEELIQSSYATLKTILDSTTERSPAINLFTQQFSLAQYEWAYFTVNTRCVYMDLTDIVDFTSIKSPLLLLLNDNQTIALCPYLDMINHSSSVKNVTKLVVKECSNTGRLTQLNKGALSNIRFTLYTMNCVAPYSQVFICYGDSHNMKLVTEYGFFLPNNDLDCVEFDFADLKQFLTTQNIKLSQEQCTFITSHGLCKDLYIDSSGLSFNFYALLTVLKFYYKQKADISKVIYTGDVSGADKNSLVNLILPLISQRILEITECENKLKMHDAENTNIANCVSLLGRYIEILEIFVKR